MAVNVDLLFTVGSAVLSEYVVNLSSYMASLTIVYIEILLQQL